MREMTVAPAPVPRELASTTRVVPSGVERTFGAEEIIVSKTDTKGVITYANETLLWISGYREAELLGQPHSLIRHPDMPRAVFRLLWTEVEAGREVFAYVLNLAKDGAHYWVFAHVTPTLAARGQIVGYHSNRRSPARRALQQVGPLYAQLRAEEARHHNVREAADAGHTALQEYLADRQISYSQLVWSLDGEGNLG